MQSRVLTLSSLSSISGRVYAIDGYTPISGATVNLSGKDYQTTGLDGSYAFRNLAPNSSFTVTAEFVQNGIFRTATSGASTPFKGGPVSNVNLILMKQGSVEGKIVDGSGNPIKYARYWLREMYFPGRWFGSQSDPLITDENGHFRVNNVFTVPVRLSAVDPNNPDLTGGWNGVLTNEGEVATPTIVIGSAGTGSVTFTVLDPNAGYVRVPNAELSLYRGSLFDFATTGPDGTATFNDVPVGQYTATAYSKTLGKLGSSTSSFTINRDQNTAIQITLLYSGEVDGTLIDPQNGGAAVPGANVTLYASGYQTRSTTGVDGAFDFKGIREGYVDLEARDPLSIRRAWNNSILVSTAAGTTHLSMALEDTSALTVKAYLPNDTGDNSGILAPLVNIDVNQYAPGGHYQRTSQTNGARFPGLVRERVNISVGVQEIGGRNRYKAANLYFDHGEGDKELTVTFPAFGSALVHVKQGTVGMPNVFVNVVSGGIAANGYTDANGDITLSNLPLGSASVQASTLGVHPLTGATSVQILRQSQAAETTISLGSYKGVQGYVDAEAGGPSAGTRVFAAYSGFTLETRTDATGFYEFHGFIGYSDTRNVVLTFLGPDDATVGAVVQAAINSSSPEVTTVDRVKLDSTPPRVVSIFPKDASSAVAPDTSIVVTFSRAMNIDQLGGGYVTLWDVGSNSSVHLSLDTAILQPDKSLVATFKTGTPPPGQRYALKSNTLYRIQVSSDILDSGGHRLGVTVGASFTTSDYANPQVTNVVPSTKLPLPKNNLRFAVTFSKPLVPGPWNPGGNGVMQLVQIDHIGGNPVAAPLPGSVQLSADAATLYFAPDALLLPEKAYRLSISGAVDANGNGLIDSSGNPISVWTQDFTSYDETAPIVTIGTPLLLNAPIAAGDPLYSGVSYTIPVTLTNPDGSNATDVAGVDFYSVDSTGAVTAINHTSMTSVTVTPLDGWTSLTLKVIAHDQSDNYSADVTKTWTVQAVPPLAIASTAVAPSVIYPGQSFTDTVTLSGGTISANVAVSAYIDENTIPAVTRTATVTRSSFTAAWPATTLTLSVPVATPGATKIKVIASATDARGAAQQRTDQFTLAADTSAPILNPLSIQVIRSSAGSGPASFNNNDQYRVHAYARDGETAVQSVTFTINGQTYVVSSGTYNASTQLYDFVTPTITVQSHNQDLTVPISAVATDYGQNSTTGGTTVTYLGIHDENAPTVTWISPLHDAAWPAGRAAFRTRLSVYATSKLPLNAHFDVPGLTTITGVRNGNQFDADITLDVPSDKPSITVTAHVDDGDGGHIIDLPIAIDLVSYTRYFETGTIAVQSSDPMTGESIVVDSAHLVPHVAMNVKNLIVVNGGSVETVRGTTQKDESVTLTVTDHLFVDGRSYIDVSSRGYLGGYQTNFDNTGTNSDPHGRTVSATEGGSIVNGAVNSSGSHAGIGGEEPGYASNATYGSITAPATRGSGGGADLSNRRGGQGGGLVAINATSGAGKIVVAGWMSADGESGIGIGGAGAGGSIHLSGKTVVLGSNASVTANGGDDDGGAPAQRGGGGGRISIEGSSLLDIDTTTGSRIAARGGRNATSEVGTAVDGGAGTIFLRYPGETNGELLVDSGFKDSLHLTRGTVIAGAQTFDRVTVASRALLRLDDSITAGGATDDRTTMTIDPTALVALATDLPAINVTTTPASGASILQNTNLSVTYLATSYSGIGRVTATLDPSLATKLDGFDAYGANATATDTLLIPPTAVAGSTATLHVRAIDRAGRVIDAPAQTFTIAANAAPVITAFDLNAPSPLYIGGSFTATVGATDDTSVTTLGLTTQFGSGTPSTQTFTANATPASNTFTVNVPSDKTLDGQSITLTASANDGFPNRTTTMVKTLTIAHDGTAPAVAITQPAAGATFNEGNSNLIHIVATVIEAESGIGTVTATIEGGETVTLAGSGSTRSGDIHVPNVPDGNDVQRTITITARDVVGNSGTGSVAVNVHPLYDPTAPVVTWNCGTDGAMYPPGYVATLSATVVPGATGTAVDTVTFSDGTTTVTATKSGNTYSAAYTVPNTPGQPVTINLVAKSIGGGTTNLVGTLNVVAIDKTISTSTSIIQGDATYDNQNVAITGGTVTIAGHHEFKTLLVLGNAVVTHTSVTTAASARVDIKADALYIACSAGVDVSGQGYGGGTAAYGAPGAGDLQGGSHLGAGGRVGTGATWSSVTQPQDAGGGGGAHSPNYYTTWQGAPGGGRIHIEAGKLQLDGNVYANGYGPWSAGGGAGGSIWIRATKIWGNGIVMAGGGAGANDSSSGGGGAVAVEYSDATSSGSWLTNLNAQGATGTGTSAAGTVWIKGPGATYGTLNINNRSISSGSVTDLPSLGSGTLLTGTSNATLVTDRTTDIPAFFVGHWVEVHSAAGALRGRWQVASLNAKTITLALNANETTGIIAGDTWRGVYRFDAVNLSSTDRLYSGDNILINDVATLIGTTAAGQTVYYPQPVVGDDINVVGRIAAASIRANSLTVAGYLTHPSGGALSLNVSGTLTVPTGGQINVDGVGYGATATYPGANGVANSAGGSHLGDGGSMGVGASFGNVYQPQELGGGGGNEPYCCGAFVGAPGGGRIAIQTGTLQIDGSITANGYGSGSGNSTGGGAGGSIWITATKILGGGLIQAAGGAGRVFGGGGGGGGAIAITYSDATSGGAWQSQLAANGASSSVAAAAGTVLMKGPSDTYGNLVIDNKGSSSGSWTELPALGRGFAITGTSGSTVVTDRSSTIPAYFAGNWVEIDDPAGTIKGTWRIATVNNKTITLLPNGNETINVVVGDTWRGIYRFDSITQRNGGRLTSADSLSVNGNTAPVFNASLRSQIIVNNTTNGSFVTGPAGAVTDSDQPIKLTVTSNRGTVFSANANGDGSFNVPVSGSLGDTFTIYATDSNTYPAISPAIAVNGQLAVYNPLTAFNVQPATISPGGTVTISLRLTNVPSGATPVTLTTSTNALPLPTTFTIPAGSVSASFTVTSTAVTVATTANLTAFTSGSPKSATVTILPDTAALSDVSVSPSTFVSGTTATGTVTLAGAAPSAGAVVLLSTSNSAVVTVPQSVTVPPGATSVTFTVTAVQTGTADVVAIYGSTKSASVTVSACGTMPHATAATSPSNFTTWIDEPPLPSGQSLNGGAVAIDQAASGTSSVFLSGGGQQSFAITGGTTWSVANGDRLVVHALINPCKPPRQIQIIWKDTANNEHRASWGEDLIDTTTAHAQIGAMIAGGQWIRLEALASTIGAGSTSISSITVQTYDGEAWFDLFGKYTCAIDAPVAAPQLNPSDTVWFDDAPPTGATEAPASPPDTYAWIWDSSQHASGAKAHTDGIHAGAHKHVFIGASPAFTVANGDVLTVYVLIDPCNPVKGIGLQWNDGSWEHRAYWGDDFLPGGTNGTESRYRMGPLPPAGVWVRLEVPAAFVGLEGRGIQAMSFDSMDGQMWFDRVGRISRVNLALNKPAQQSSVVAPAVASRAVDGNTDGALANGSVAQTQSAAQAWWEVDLGASLPIEDVQIWNRTDSCTTCITNFWLLISDQPMSTDLTAARAQSGVSAYHLPLQPARASNFRVNRAGRYVRVQLDGTNSLNLAEVQVWAPATSMRTNLAGGGAATQSSNYSDPFSPLPYYAEFAVNGDAISNFDAAGSQSATNTETDPHWDIDLGSIQSISSIDVLHRTDCARWNCGSTQLANFYLFVSDRPFSSPLVAQTIAQSGVGVWYHGLLQTPSLMFPVNRTGRYVRLARSGTALLTLNEVRIWSAAPAAAPLSTTSPKQ